MNPLENAEEIVKVFENISAASRLAILLVIGEGEACVCHLEAVLGKRQAYISQHLMALRDAGIITPRRDGRFIYYRITDRGLFDLIRNAARLAGVEITAPAATTLCECPECAEQKPGYLASIDKA